MLRVFIEFLGVESSHALAGISTLFSELARKQKNRKQARDTDVMLDCFASLPLLSPSDFGAGRAFDRSGSRSVSPSPPPHFTYRTESLLSRRGRLFASGRPRLAFTTATFFRATQRKPKMPPRFAAMNGPKQAMQRTTSLPTFHSQLVCHPRVGRGALLTGLAVAELVSLGDFDRWETS